MKAKTTVGIGVVALAIVAAAQFQAPGSGRGGRDESRRTAQFTVRYRPDKGPYAPPAVAIAWSVSIGDTPKNDTAYSSPWTRTVVVGSGAYAMVTAVAARNLDVDAPRASVECFVHFQGRQVAHDGPTAKGAGCQAHAHIP